MRVRPPGALRLGLGAVALLRPGLVVRVSGAPDGVTVRRVVRVLGARYVVQSAGGAALDRAWVPPADAAVDLVHAASMLGLAALRPAYGSLALLSAGAAVGFAVGDLRGVGS
jgi:hypothetical protein